MSERAPKKKHIEWSWRSRVVRGWVYQAIALLCIGGGVWFLAYNTQVNMEAPGIQSGFLFLGSSSARGPIDIAVCECPW